MTKEGNLVITPAGFTPAFGRVEAPLNDALAAWLKPCPTDACLSKLSAPFDYKTRTVR
jgi:hypothetical protein